MSYFFQSLFQAQLNSSLSSENIAEGSAYINDTESIDEDYYDDVDDDDDYSDYYNFNDTEYEYLPEFNNSVPTAGSEETIILPSNETLKDVILLQANISSPMFGLEGFREMLRSLSIDEEMLPYVAAGVIAAIALFLCVICGLCCFLCRKRFSNRLGFGRQFDTFQNPIYEKTMTRVPVGADDDELDEEKQASEPLDVKPIKTESEDLSDSTGLD